MKAIMTVAALAALLTTTALAQPAPPPGGPAAWGQTADIQGVVKAFTMTPVGDLEGMVLTDGTEVHVPPHLSAQLAAVVKPGESVRVRGQRTATPNFIVANALTGERGQSVVDQGPPPPGLLPPPVPPGQSQRTSVEGRVAQLLHGPAGDVNGALLEDGTILKVPPHVARRTMALRPGQSVSAQGWAVTTSYGRVVEAQTVAERGSTAQATSLNGVVAPPAPAPASTIGAAPPAPPSAAMAR